MSRRRAHEEWCELIERLLVTEPGSVANVLDRFTDHQTAVARAVVQGLGIGPWLAGRLADQTPAGPQSYAFMCWLADLRTLNAERMRRWDGHRRGILQAMAAEQIDVLPLKSTILVPECWADPAERPTADLDFLVRPTDFDRAHAAMTALGFGVVAETFRQRAYFPPGAGPANVNLPGEHPEQPIGVELLRHVDRDAAGVETRLTTLLWESSRRNESGGLSPLLWAVVLHAAVHAGRNASMGACRFTAILDLAAAAHVLPRPVWDDCAEMAEQLHVSRFVYGPLLMAERYGAATFPSGVLSRLEAGTPPGVSRWIQSSRFGDWYWNQNDFTPTERLFVPTHWAGSTRGRIVAGWRYLMPTRLNRVSDSTTMADASALRYFATRIRRWAERKASRLRARPGSAT